MTGRNIIQCFSLRLAALVLVLLAGAASLAWLNKWQIDLTQGKLYTLSQGTRSINCRYRATHYTPVLLQRIPDA